MTEAQVQKLAKIAPLMALTLKQTIALPAVVDTAAGKVGMSIDDFIANLERNLTLRNYLHAVCVEAAHAL